jgi:Fic family protein
MNMVLLQNGYTLTHIKGDTVSRLAYYRSLEDVQVNNNPEPFYELVIDSVIHSLQEHLKMV